MPCAYGYNGYIAAVGDKRAPLGKDGDKLDVFIGEHPSSTMLHLTATSVPSCATPLFRPTIDQLKHWIEKGDHKKEYANGKKISGVEIYAAFPPPNNMLPHRKP
jgi:hypothetical protein